MNKYLLKRLGRLEARVKKLETKVNEITRWINFWESYDSGWNNRRKKKP